MKGSRMFLLLLLMGWMVNTLPLKGQSVASALKYLEEGLYQPELFLPYMASKEREAQLQGNMNKLATGLTTEEVRALLGPPDLIEAVFTKGDRTEELSAFQYLYLFQRVAVEEWGKPYEDRSLRLTFHLNGKLAAANGYAVKGFKELVREQGLGFRFAMGLHEKVLVNDLLIQLDFVVNPKPETSAEAPQGTPSAGSEVVLSLILPDRQDNLKFSFNGQNASESKFYGTYKITVLAVPDTRTTMLIVE